MFLGFPWFYLFFIRFHRFPLVVICFHWFSFVFFRFRGFPWLSFVFTFSLVFLGLPWFPHDQHSSFKVSSPPFPWEKASSPLLGLPPPGIEPPSLYMGKGPLPISSTGERWKTFPPWPTLCLLCLHPFRSHGADLIPPYTGKKSFYMV